MSSARALKACFVGSIAAIGTATSYWQEQQRLKYDAPRGRRMVREMEKILSETKESNRKQLADLMEFCECADELQEVQKNMWEERVRRWLSTATFEEQERAIEMIFFNWKRLEKLYKDMSARSREQFRNGNFGDIVDVSLKLHDIKAQGTTDAATPAIKSENVRDTIHQISDLTGDPMFVALEKSYEMDPSIAFRMTALIMSLKNSLEDSKVEEEITANNILDYWEFDEIEAAYPKIETLPRLLSNSSESVQSSAAELERLAYKYAVSVQTSHIFEAYMASLQMGLISASPTTQWKK
eukprot:TRINITY_DN16104_c0_g1_i1.p1 TRINITY_DN16104_c0_g1~~TRINITY_DN16104_c0_g1_i1.p1  ORF type:complete len:325 (+),score=52.32 TRINITY_DN16104_c0_g1_i1:85-975(+)